jgi:hypothetical protein
MTEKCVSTPCAHIWINVDERKPTYLQDVLVLDHGVGGEPQIAIGCLSKGEGRYLDSWTVNMKPWVREPVYHRVTHWMPLPEPALTGGDVQREARPVAATTPASEKSPPIDMLLFCPRCGEQHIDAPKGDWTNPPHATHTCQHCGLLWRPSNALTNGAAIIPAGEAKHVERIAATWPGQHKQPNDKNAHTDDVEWLRRFLNCTPFGPPPSEIQRAHNVIDDLLSARNTSRACTKERDERVQELQARLDQSATHADIYAACLFAVQGERLADPVPDSEGDIAYDKAVRDCEQAILALRERALADRTGTQK